MTLTIVRLAAAVLFLLPPASATGIELRIDVLASLGGPAGGGSFIEDVTAGLPVIGSASNQDYVEIVGFWIAADPVVTGTTEEPSAALPAYTVLEQNVPNPFNPVTHIRFRIARDVEAGEAVRLEVFDVDGRFVTALVDEPLAPGIYRVSWDGHDAAGRQVASGVYFARLRAGQYKQVIRLVATK